jgi:hypothetical protein
MNNKVKLITILKKLFKKSFDILITILKKPFNILRRVFISLKSIIAIL